MPGAEAGRLARGLRAAGLFLLRVPWPLALTLVVAWGFLIWDLSAHSIRLPEQPSLFLQFVSNLAHAPLFGILTLFLAGALLRQREGGWPRERPWRYALVLGAVLGYGILDEWHQGHIPGRDASVFDVLTDLVSASLVLWIVRTLGRAENEPTLVRRLLVGVCLSLGSALLATLA